MNRLCIISDEYLRQAAKKRIACLFRVDAGGLSVDTVFGKELQASFVSNWKDNEFDELLHDIRDVADQKTRKKMDSGDLIIRTVGDYCEHMVNCYRAKPKMVVQILFGAPSNRPGH